MFYPLILLQRMRLIKEANSIPDFIAKPLCQEAMKLIENLGQHLKSEEELYEAV